MKWIAFAQQHTATGMPEVGVGTGQLDSGAVGEFDPSTWDLCLAAGLLKDRTSLGTHQCAEIATTVYHELRHAEQYFAMAYYVCVENPGMSVFQVHYKLAGIKRDVILEAKRQAGRFRQRDLYNFGKAMYFGEFGGAEAKHKELLKLCKERIGRLRDLCERNIANVDLDQAEQYVQKVAAVIGKYNQTRPSGTLPDEDATALKDGGFRLRALWQALVKASRAFNHDPGAYYQAYFRYLTALRGFVRDRWKKAYAAYATSVTEHDAFAVEEMMKLRLRQRGLQLDAGARTIRMIAPVQWTVPGSGYKPPPPSVPSTGSGLSKR